MPKTTPSKTSTKAVLSHKDVLLEPEDPFVCVAELTQKVKLEQGQLLYQPEALLLDIAQLKTKVLLHQLHYLDLLNQQNVQFGHKDQPEHKG